MTSAGMGRSRGLVAVVAMVLLGPVLVGCQLDRTGIEAAGAGPAVARPPDAGRPMTPPAPPGPDAATPRPAELAVDGAQPVDAAAETAVDEVGPREAGTDAAVAETGGVSGATSVGAGADCPDTAQLALCLRFEGNAVDQSRHKLPVLNPPTTYAISPRGMAIDLRPGVRMSVAETPVLDSPVLTIEVVVNPRKLGRRMTIVENLGQYGLYILPSGSVMCTGAGTYALINDGVAPGRWTRLTCAFDGNEVALFIDDRRSRIVPAPPLTTDRTLGLWIGWEDLPGREFDGLMDELRIWRTARRP